MRKLIQSAAVALAVLGLAAAAAYADGTIYAAPPDQFFGGDITIAQGGAVTFTNVDTVTHDVTAAAKARTARRCSRRPRSARRSRRRWRAWSI
jgi:plastocyanin